MEGREQVIQARRADEIIIEATVAAGLSIGEAEVEIDDRFGGDFRVLTDDLD